MFSPGQQALPLSFFVQALMLDDEEEAAELCTLYQLPVEQQGGESFAVINRVNSAETACMAQAALLIPCSAVQGMDSRALV